MFICEKCKKTTRAGEKQNKVIVESRERNYYYTNKYGKEMTSKGSEIVKEINVCEECFELLKKVGE